MAAISPAPDGVATVKTCRRNSVFNNASMAPRRSPNWSRAPDGGRSSLTLGQPFPLAARLYGPWATLRGRRRAMAYDCFNVTIEGGVAHLQLKRREAMNSMIRAF